MKKLLLASSAALIIQARSAHGVWVTPHFGELSVVYGMGVADDAYGKEKLAWVNGYDEKFATSEVVVSKKPSHSTIDAKDAAVLTVFFNNGFWEKGENGRWKEVAEKDISKPVDTSTSLKYNISVLKSYQGEMKPFAELPVQVIPEQDPSAVKQGEQLVVTVYVDGKPAADVPVTNDYINNFAEKQKTDKDGKVTLTVRNDALNVIAALVNHPTPDDAKAHLQRSVATLSFKAAKK